jgi:menaquinone reductase, multiheme cytochrome c subunit
VLTPGIVRFLAGFAFMLIIGWVVFPFALYEKIEQPFLFSHKIHTGESTGMSCQDCHHLNAEGRFSGIPKIAKCVECHADVVGSSPHEKFFVENYVKKNIEVPWLVYSRQPQNVSFSHASHIKLTELDCKECHGDHGSSDTLRAFERNRISGYSRDIWGSNIARIKKASWDGKKMDDCADCHEKRNVANTCLKCHK